MVKNEKTISAEENVRKAHLHAHSDDSGNDGAQTVFEYAERAHELGYDAIALTDHGTLQGIERFRKACKEIGIKPILGVEAYYKSSTGKKSHLCLYAKNYTGYQAIMKAISKANHFIDAQDAPIIDTEMLQFFFGKGGLGYGNVIATSACAGGVLANILLQNKYIEKSIDKLHRKNSALPNPSDESYLMLKEEVKGMEEALERMTEEYKRLQEIAGKTYKAKRNKIKPEVYGEEEAARLLAELDAEEAETIKAKEQVPVLRKTKGDFSKKLTVKKQELAALELKHQKYYSNLQEIEDLEKSILTEKEIRQKTLDELLFFKEVFGEGNFYVELQNHRWENEIYVYPLLAKLAKKTNTPVVVTNDAHFARKSPESFRRMQILRGLRFNKFREFDKEDEELYIKTEDELRDIVSEIIPKEMVEEGLRNAWVIAEQCNVEFPKTSNYPVYKDPKGRTSKECLEHKARKGISWRMKPEDWTEEYENRLQYELSVIDKLGFNDYLLIVEDFLRYGRLLGQLSVLPERAPTMEDLEAMTKDFPTGVAVGPGRGSAVGSLVCYLTGITALDPLKYGLIFERFLNTERVSMPDIDSDFRPDVRELVIEYCENKYGKDAVCGIMARGTMQAKAAIRNCARLYGDELYQDTKHFLSLGDEICKEIDDDCETDSEIKEALVKKFADNKEALVIINDAFLVTGYFANVTKHAAGVVISGCPDVTDYLPLLYVAGKDAFCSQFDKKFVEKLNCLKMDFLGLRNLNFINKTLCYMRDNHGVTVDIENLPFEKKVFEKIFSSGNTNAVFQFESNGMKQMLREFKPDCFEDLILLVAAYRPGPLQYLPKVIAIKQGKEKPNYVIPEMETVLGKTYGCPIYQEQIQQIFNKFAGFTLGEADIVRRLMAAKDAVGFSKYKDKFISGLIEHGAIEKDAISFWEELLKFSEYAFNKSHACAYAYVAYITGYLKYHYPAEYLCAVMNYTDFDKLKVVLGDCRTFNIKVLPPNINDSEENFSIKNGAIICGFGTIKGVASSGALIREERRLNGPYSSFADFLLRTKIKKDAVENLIYGGTFDMFFSNRSAMINNLPSFTDVLDKIKDSEKKIVAIKALLDDNDAILIKLQNKALESAQKKQQKGDTSAVPKEITEEDIKKERASLNKKRRDREEAIKTLVQNLYALPVVNTDENKQERLKNEREVLGAYISSTPLDGYEMPSALKCVPISELTDKKEKVTIMGFISDLMLKKTKKDNSDIAFFNLEDQTGIIRVNCFSKAFKKYGKYILEGAVIKIVGYCKKTYFNEEERLEFTVDAIEVLHQTRKPITFFVKHLGEWTDLYDAVVKKYVSEDGYPFVVYDETTGLFSSGNVFLEKGILQDDRIKSSI